jgi:hypothetical protein
MALLLFIALAPLVAPAGATEMARSVGIGQGVLIDPLRDAPCGYLRLSSDNQYENGYAWDGFGIGPPYYGAFAECFIGQHPEVCAVVLDLTSIGYPLCHIDLFVWDDAGGVPGNILSLTPDVDTGPVAVWPQISRHVLPLDFPAYPEGTWWAGWCQILPQYYPPPIYIAADLEPDGLRGCPYTNIPPDIGYPEGWNPVSVVWGPTSAIGIGIYAHTMLPSEVTMPEPAGELTSWGKVKATYR